MGMGGNGNVNISSRYRSELVPSVDGLDETGRDDELFKPTRPIIGVRTARLFVDETDQLAGQRRNDSSRIGNTRLSDWRGR